MKGRCCEWVGLIKLFLEAVITALMAASLKNTIGRQNGQGYDKQEVDQHVNWIHHLSSNDGHATHTVTLVTGLQIIPAL